MVDEEDKDGPGPRQLAGVPTVAILSLREIRPVANYGGLREAEDVLVELLSAGLYRVQASSPRYRSGRLSTPALRSLLSTTRVVKPFRIEQHQTESATADVLLVLVRDLADARVLLGLPGWHRLGERVLVHVEAVTDRDLRRYPEVVVHLRKRADALFAASEMPPLSYLTTLHGRLRTVSVVPPMLDVLAFPARPDPAERTIDVFSPGKVPSGQNELLRSWAARNDASYQHGIGELGGLSSDKNRRDIFTSMATKARVFVTNHSSYGGRGGLHRGVDTRFFEAMAAGCVLVGDLPVESRMFAEYVAPAQPLGFEADARRIPEAVLAALEDRAVSDEQGRVARAAALRANDVAHRWRQMCEAVGLPVAESVTDRIAQLARMAEGGEPDASPGPGSGVAVIGTTPDDAVPDDAVPDDAVPDDAVPGDAVPGAAVPGAAVPDQGESGQVPPIHVVPDDAVPDDAPDDAVPDDAVPDGSSPPVLRPVPDPSPPPPPNDPGSHGPGSDGPGSHGPGSHGPGPNGQRSHGPGANGSGPRGSGDPDETVDRA